MSSSSLRVANQQGSETQDCCRINTLQECQNFKDNFAAALILSLSYLILVVGSVAKFNVADFGAVGDGTTDDTQAFQKAWAFACGSSSDASTMIVPKDKNLFIMPTTFRGPCKSHVNFQIKGTIVAPDRPSTWNGIDPSEWLQFKSISGLTVEGPGEINGRGYKWWKQSCRNNPTQGCTTAAPTALKFIGCNDLQVSHLTSVDSAQTHLVILSCQRVGVDNITITAPENSPNTDGIHIHASQHVMVEDSSIGTGMNMTIATLLDSFLFGLMSVQVSSAGWALGRLSINPHEVHGLSPGDDCISIGDYVSDIGIKNIFCGPGHGISVGSLGRGGTEASAEGIHVEHVNFQNTSNGARIKTWQGAKGFARGISFKNCIFNNVQNPIVIDQYYCDVANNCKSKSTAVRVSNVTYANFQGTSRTPLAVSMNCSRAIPCTVIQFDTVNLTLASPEADTKAYCINAYGYTKGFIHPTLDCLCH